MSDYLRAAELNTPVTLFICPLRSKASDAQTEKSKVKSSAEEFLRRFNIKEAYHYALGIRDEIFELTRDDNKYSIKRTPLKQWKNDKDPRGKGGTPGWEDRGVLGHTQLSNDLIFHLADEVIWIHWKKKYRLFFHDCQHFVKLLCKSICQFRIKSKQDYIGNIARFGGGNIKDLFRKGKGYPFRWNRVLTEYPTWCLVAVGGSLALAGTNPPAVTIIFIVALSYMTLNLGYRGMRWAAQRDLRKALAKEVEALLKQQDAQAKCDEDKDACSFDRLLLAQ